MRRIKSLWELPWWFSELVLFLLWGILVNVGEKIVEHIEQLYLKWKFERQRPKRGKNAKKQRR